MNEKQWLAVHYLIINPYICIYERRCVIIANLLRCYRIWAWSCTSVHSVSVVMCLDYVVLSARVVWPGLIVLVVVNKKRAAAILTNCCSLTIEKYRKEE